MESIWKAVGELIPMELRAGRYLSFTPLIVASYIFEYITTITSTNHCEYYTPPQ